MHIRTRAMMTLAAASASALALALASAGPAAADIQMLENGGFESPDIPTGSWGVFSSIPGWTATKPSCGIEVQDHVAGDPAKGGQFVELNANCPSGISTPALPAARGTYYLMFRFSPRPGTPAQANIFKLRVNGLETTYKPGYGGSTTSWKADAKFFTVDGTSPTITIQFIYAGSSPYAMGAYIDDVQLYKYF